MRSFVADFETTTKEDDCRVWAWAVCEVGNRENVIIGNTLDSFMEWCRSHKDNVKVFFHNLKFDGQWLIWWALKNDFEYVEDPKDRKTHSFTTMISDMGMYYSIELVYYRHKKNLKNITFQDSLKLIPMSVEGIAKALHLPIQKGEIDYKAHDDLPEGSPISQEEEEYIKHDVQIVAYALEYFLSQGMDKMTVAACALAEYKRTLTKFAFKDFYPTPSPEHHNDIKQSYKGGFSYLNPKFKGKIVKDICVLDINSMYPAIMASRYLPFDVPIFYKGKYEEDRIYPLYVQMFRCKFKLKKGKIPSIQLKHNIHFNGTEYLTSSNGEEIVLCLTSVDMKLFYDQYDVSCEEWISGWKFKATKGLYKNYITKWSNNKIQAKKDENWGLYTISKLYLNSLYGKMGADIQSVSKIPYLDENDVVHYKDGDPKPKKGIYIAMASFITSYGRDQIIRAAQTITDAYNAGESDIQFIYSDTDSLHIKSPRYEMPKGLDIDDTILGYWKYEGRAIRGKYIRAKCYIEELTEDVYNFDDPEFKLKVTVAGMPKSCHSQVTFNNFKVGATYSGKLQHKIVRGGAILKECDFTIIDD